MSEKELKTKRSINRLWRFLNVLFFICFVWFAYDRDSGKHVFGYIFLAAAIISCIIRRRYQKMLNQLQDERDFKFSSEQLFVLSRHALICSVLLCITRTPFFTENFDITSHAASTNQILLLIAVILYFTFAGIVLAGIAGVISLVMFLSILFNKKTEATRPLAISVVLCTFSVLIGIFSSMLLSHAT